MVLRKHFCQGDQDQYKRHYRGGEKRRKGERKEGRRRGGREERLPGRSLCKWCVRVVGSDRVVGGVWKGLFSDVGYVVSEVVVSGPRWVR